MKRVIFLSLALSPALSFAEPAGKVYFLGLDEILLGDPVSTSVDTRGYISAGPSLKQLSAPIGAPISSLVRDSAAAWWVGTAGDGVYRVDVRGRKRQLLKDKALSTVLAGRGAEALVAIQPGGQVQAVSAEGKTRPVVKLPAEYVWSALKAPGGWLFATGAPGRIVKARRGKQETLYEAEAKHVRVMLRHKRRGLVFGTARPGVVYELDEKNKRARALYDAGMEEVTALAEDVRTGDLYAAFVSAKGGSPEPLPGRWMGRLPSDGKPNKRTQPIKQSQVVRIRASGEVDVLWSSGDEGAVALVFDAAKRRLLIGTGGGSEAKGRVYAIFADARDRLQLLARVEAPIVAALAPAGRGAFLIGGAPDGALTLLGERPNPRSVYLSKTEDLGRPAQLGRLWFDATRAGGAVALSARTGNTKTPDETWSRWSQAVKTPAGGAVHLPRGRYVQLRVIIEQKGKARPVVKAIYGSFKRRNLAPQISALFPLTPAVALAPIPDNGHSDKQIMVSAEELKKLRDPPRVRPKTRARQWHKPGWRTAAWTATDPNRDRLLYTLWLRALDDPRGGWRLLSEAQEAPYFSFDAEGLPDGRYALKLRASDRPDNAPAEAKADELESEPFVIDNSPPVIEALKVKRVKGGLRLSATIVDASSPLSELWVSVSGGPWLYLPARDGMVDAPREQAELRIPYGPGVPANKPLTISVRAEDEAKNQSTRSLRLN